MSIIGNVRERLIANRRADVLCRCLSDVLPQNAQVLDVGCGDGFLATKIMSRRPDVRINGIDVLIRPVNHIPVQEFNGEQIPMADDSVDVVSFVDVLHHTDDPLILLREACRVARKAVVIKDHTRNGLFANSTLRFMDWIGLVMPIMAWHCLTTIGVVPSGMKLSSILGLRSRNGTMHCICIACLQIGYLAANCISSLA